MNDSDLAKLLQEEYDREVAFSLEEDITNTQIVEIDRSTSAGDKNKYSQVDNQSLKVASTSFNPGLSPVDPSLELTDPNPDIRLMFLQFNAQFFWNKLMGIEVKWSPRMTLCAGVCVYEGRGGLCSVRLSLPLLKLRPRKDLVETLLHEMIHAYLFVTHNDSDHSDHGHNFLSHMHRINKTTGAGISVYHTFHDEVESYQQHWWRCDGPCQKRAPYYGYVKRSMNRAPSARDLWWADHQASCGGVYTKVKEPEGFGQKKTGKEKVKEDKTVDPSKDIRTFWGQGHILGSSSQAKPKMDNAIPKGRTASQADNKIVRASSSDVINQFSGNKSIVESMKNFTPRNSLFTVTKSTTDHSTSSATNGYKEIPGGSTFQHRISGSLPNKHSLGSSTNNKGSDIDRRLNLGSGSSPGQNSASGLTLSDANNLHSKSRAGQKHTGNKLNKTVEGNILRSRNNKRWRKTPDMNNKKVVFPKNFISVCTGVDFSNSVVSKKTKRKVYIIDDLDSNEGLWEENEDNNAHTNYTASSSGNKKATESAIAVIPGNMPAKATIKGTVVLDEFDRSVVKNEPEESSCSDSDRQETDRSHPSEGNTKTIVNRNDWNVRSGDSQRGSQPSSNVAPEIISSNRQLAVTEGKAGRFTGKGQMLGTGEGGTSLLSHIRKKWFKGSEDSTDHNSNMSSQSSLFDRQPKTSQINDAIVRSPSSARKRTSGQAFSDQDSDMDMQIDKVGRSSEGAAQNVFDNRMGSVLQSSVHEMPCTDNHNRADSQGDMVPCPSCTVMVPLGEINAHLDLCLF